MGYNFFSSLVSIIGNTVFSQLCNTRHYSVIFLFYLLNSTATCTHDTKFSSSLRYTHAHTHHKTCILCNLFLFLVNCYCNIVALQYCVSFCWAAKWINYMYIYNPPFFRFLSHFGYHRALSLLCYTVSSHQLSILYIVECYVGLLWWLRWWRICLQHRKPRFGLGRSPGEGMVTHSSILAWRTPWTQEPDGLQSMGSRLSTAHNSVLCQSQSSPSFSLLGIYKYAIHFKVFSVFPLKSLLNIPF